jgi:hypothetical protein
MTQDNRWSIQELLARYDLEPELVDLFVEGAFDKEVLTQACASNIQRRAVYEIDSVDVPASVLAKHGLSHGNKQRVIALSKELAGIAKDAKVVCLVDRDLDHWFAPIENTHRLRWTLFCSLECHFMTAETIRDIAVTTGRAKIKQFDQFTEGLLSTIRALYALRLSDRELGLNLKWVALRKYLKRVDDSVVFDAARYSTALLASNAKSQTKGAFDTATADWIKKLTCDIRLSARGHDYTALLAWAISEFGGEKELASEVAVERLFVLLARSIGSLSAEIQ